MSLPLLVSGQLGNHDFYRVSLNRMQKAMDKLEPGPFKAWLYGRMVFSAHSIKDLNTETDLASTLKVMIDKILQDETLRVNITPHPSLCDTFSPRGEKGKPLT